ENYDFNPVNGTLIFSALIENETYIDPSSLQISNIKYRNILTTDLGALHKFDIPESIQATIQEVKTRDVSKYVLSFNPIIKEGNSYKRIESLTYSYSKTGVRSLDYITSSVEGRMSSVLRSGTWF